MKRRCGRQPGAQATPPQAVWARRNVSTTECPRSFISGASLAWLEQFHAWKRLGFPEASNLSARDVHAMLVLEQEWLAEAAAEQDR